MFIIWLEALVLFPAARVKGRPKGEEKTNRAEWRPSKLSKEQYLPYQWETAVIRKWCG